MTNTRVLEARNTRNSTVLCLHLGTKMLEGTTTSPPRWQSLIEAMKKYIRTKFKQIVNTQLAAV